MVRPASLAATVSGIFAIALAVPAAAVADVIVMKDGARVESAGAWEVRSSMVVFKDARGRLVSLQLDDVDVDASRRATEAAVGAAERAAAAKATATAAPTRQAVLVITDSDVAKASPAAPAGDEAAPGETGKAAEGEAAREAERPSRVVVSEWVKEFNDEVGGVTIRGTLRNADDTTTATNVRVVIELFDDEGRRITAVTVLGQPAALAPDASGRFEVQVPGVRDFAAARFEVRSLALATGESAASVVPQQAYEQRQAAEADQPQS